MRSYFDIVKTVRTVLLSCLFVLLSIPVFSAEPDKGKIESAKNTIMAYGGIGFGSYSYYDRFKIDKEMPAHFGFIYQRDFLKRLSAELQLGGSYLDNMPSNMKSEWSYDSMKSFMSALAATELDDPLANSWYRQNTVELTLRPVFHIISSYGNRLSVYAGLGYTFFDINTINYSYIHRAGPIIIDVGVDMDMYRLNSFSWDVGLRYSYALKDKYVFGVEASYRDEFTSKAGMTTPINRNFRTSLMFGLRF